MTDAIAIVGLACCYPDAPTPAALWENSLAQRRAFRRLPPERLSLDDYFSTDPDAADCIYATNAAVIEGYEFDRARYRVGGSAYRSADLAHWLALDTAARVLEDAGASAGEGLPRAATGVFLGNTLTGEFSRANLMRLRWPYVRRVVAATLAEQDWSETQRAEYLNKLEIVYKEPFAPMVEDSLAGGLSNTIAGRICNYFDFQGCGYTVDGACSSSLLAVAQACAALQMGDVDAALAGGVDVSLDPFELVGFSRTKALAADMMRVYEARSNGFWPGEGCGFALLMRHADALAQGRKIYALIHGWGLSSDGSGGLTRPSVAGQMLALERAYRRAGFGVETVTYFEGHGTGTSVGDATELRAIGNARRAALQPLHGAAAQFPPAYIGSLKANIGHTKAAAGIAGLIKAALVLQQQIIPPLAAWERPNVELNGDAPMLQVTNEGLAWPAGRPLRAGVSSMGFGGINAHLALAGAETETAPRRRSLTTRERSLLASAQDAELFVFSAPDASALRAQLAQIQAIAARLAFSDLTDLAAQTARAAGYEKMRAAIVAATPAELAQRLAQLLALIDSGEKSLMRPAEGVFYGAATRRPVIGLLFPGQASPSYFAGGAWRRRFREVAELYERAQVRPGRHEGDTDAAQPAIITAELAALRVLERFDITAEKAVGHSLGELAAYHWAGACDENALLRVARGRGQAMMQANATPGAMASLAASATQAAALLNGEGVVISGYNAPLQTVLSGSVAGLAQVLEKARAARLPIVKLPVSHAFHSPLLAAAAPALATCLAGEEWQTLNGAVFSTITGGALAPDAGLPALLLRQITEPVRFMDALKVSGEVDLWLEAGPGRVLSGLARDLTDAPVIALDAGGASLAGLWQAVGAAFVAGQDVNHQALFAERFTRPFEINRQPKFFANPCEAAPRLDLPLVVAAPPPAAPSAPVVTAEAPATALELVRLLVAERAELPLDAVQPEHRLLSDLHLNSLTVGQLVTEAAQRLGGPRPLAPTEFADATIAEIAATLEETAERGEIVAPEEVPAGVDTWIRPFSVAWRERPWRVGPELNGGAWRVLAAPEHPLAEPLRAALANEKGGGVVVCVSPQADEKQTALLLEAAQIVLAEKDTPRLVIAQHESNGAASFARSLHLEAPRVTTCVVETPPAHPAAVSWIVAEASAAEGHSEARYDAEGRRYEPFWQPLAMPETREALPLDENDVLLVTGGGKGITAECALALARATGAKLALLGTARPAESEELARNLERLKAAGVACLYVAADVTDAAAARAAVNEIERELGPVTALLHGAAVNAPQLLANADAAQFQRALAVKVGGARHVLAAINPAQLRLFVAFGSIIARTGLPGEAAYALANEQLTQLAEDWRREHPACRCLAVEWSVWGGVGMGARLGLLDNLLRQGITPIAPETGAAMLQRLLAQPLDATAVIVTGRYREMPTYRIARDELPLLRFLERPRVYYPAVELVADAEISADTDLYLNDHQVRGERLLPAVLGLEAMAQAAQVLGGEAQRIEFSQVEFLRPIVAPENGPLTLRVAVLRRANGTIDAVLRCSATNFQSDHFRARYAPAPAETAPEIIVLPAPDDALALAPERDLYQNILFHQGRFQRLRGYRRLRARACCAAIAPAGEAAWFTPYLPRTLLLGDPGARDAALHAVQACIPHATLLPVSVEHITAGRLDAAAPHFVEAREVSQDGADFVYDLRICDESGAVRESWRGLRLRAVRGTTAPKHWAAPLLATYATRRLRELWPEITLSLALIYEPAQARQERSNRAINLALDSSEAIRRRPDGKPEAAGGRPVSAAHSGALTLGAAGLAACDLEAVTERPLEEWRNLLGPARFALAENLAQQTGEAFANAATRLWSTGECLRKAGLFDAPLTVSQTLPDGWVVLAAGGREIASFIAEMSAGGALCLAALAERSVDARL